MKNFFVLLFILFGGVLIFLPLTAFGSSQFYIDYPPSIIDYGSYVGDGYDTHVTDNEKVDCPKNTVWIFEPGLGLSKFPFINTTSPVLFINGVFQLALGSAGIAALLMIVVGGVQYMAAAGNPGGQGQAKERIQNALLGLILLAAAFLILNTISPQFTNIKDPALPAPTDVVMAAKQNCK